MTEGACGGLVPSGGTTQTVDLTLPPGSTVADCADTVTFENIVGEGSAVAEVSKETDPIGNPLGEFEAGWEFTLNHCTGPVGDECSELTPVTVGDPPVPVQVVTTCPDVTGRTKYRTASVISSGSWTRVRAPTTSSCEGAVHHYRDDAGGWENTAASGCELHRRLSGRYRQGVSSASTPTRSWVRSSSTR